MIDPEFESMIMIVVKCDPIPRHGMRRRSGFVRTTRGPNAERFQHPTFGWASEVWGFVEGIERETSDRATDREGV